MREAMALAARAADAGEVPVGALLVLEGKAVAEGYNQPVSSHDPTAHAEVVALRRAGAALRNYRLGGSTLYVTLEPCPMCAMAMIHARVARVVFGAFDRRSGAAGSRFDLLPSDHRFNHRTEAEGGLLADDCSEILKAFFRERRR